MKFRIVLVTAPDRRTARRIAEAVLQKRLAACANLVPQLESHYWWKGKLERSREVLILFKTREPLLRELEAEVAANHPYDVPEFIALPITSGAKKYLNWLARESRPARYSGPGKSGRRK